MLPQDQRDALVVKMGELLKVGGRLFVNVRGDDVNNLSSNPNNVKISENEWYVAPTGSYQKGFTKSELVAYIKDALGENYGVVSTTLFGKTSAIVTKLYESRKFSLKNSNGDTLNKNQVAFFKDSKAVDDSGNLQVVYHGTMNGKFTVFDASKASPESDMGAGFYFSSSEDDVGSNYEHGGQDLTAKIERLADIAYGLTKRVSPSAAYKIDDLFYKQSYSSDLAKAIENEDDSMIATIVGIMLNENVGGVKESSVRKELNSLVSNGYKVLPKSIGNTITYEGEEITLTNKQKEQFKTVYSEANSKVASLVETTQYKSATEEVRAKAIKYIYDIYYNLALEDLLGVDLENKNILFAEAIDIEKLAIIVASARDLTADKDKNGKTISGTKKAKVQAYVNSLQLTAVQKYMIMGYLGYSNAKGKNQVKGYIQRLSLTKSQKEQLFSYSGYAA